MSEQQVPQVSAMMGQLVAHQSGFNALPKADRQFVFQEPKAAIVVMVDAIRNRPKEPTPAREYKVLRPVAPKDVEPRPFKADETFFDKNSGVLKMVEHGVNFQAWFRGKVEKDAPTGDLRPLVILTRTALDSEIIADLGGEEKAEVTLAEIWRLMERQRNGEEDVLLTNGWANIFYVCDASGVLRAVGVCWYGGGWCARACALDADRWFDARRVFSRNS